MPGRETAGGVYDIVLDVQDKVTAILAGGNVPQTFGVTEAPLDSPCLYGIAINDVDGSLIPSANITAGTYKIEKIHVGVRSIVAEGVAMSKSDGRVYFEYTFVSAIWTLSDIFEISFNGVAVTTDGNIGEISANNVIGRVTELPNINAEVEAANTKLDAISTAISGAGALPVSTQVELTEAYLGRQLLTDPDMELGTVGAWAAHGTATVDGATWPIPRRGHVCKRVVTSAASSGIKSNLFSNPNGDVYLAEAWVRHDESVAKSFTLFLKNEDENPELDATLIPYQNNISVNPGVWTRLCGTFGGIIGTDNYRLALVSDDSGVTFYVDSCYVSRISGEELYTLLDAIKAKTENLPAAPAAVGSAMTLATDAVSADAVSAGAIAEIQSGLATSAGQGVIDGKVDAVKTQTAAIEVDTQDIQSRLTTAQTDLTTLKGYADILDDATNGNAAIKAQADAAVSALGTRALRHGRVLLSNPGDTAVATGWTANSNFVLSVDSSVFRSYPSALRFTAGPSAPAANTGCYAALTNKSKHSNRFFISLWVYTSVELRIKPRVFTAGNATNRYVLSSVYATVAANTWTKIEGIVTLSNTDSGTMNLAVVTTTTADAALSVGDYFVIDDVLVVDLDGTVEDFELRRLKNKDASITYDPTTDSLEALRDRIDAIEGTAGTATIQGIYDKVAQQKIGRSTQSASTTMTGSEQTLYEQSDTVAWRFAGGRIDLSGLADTRSITIKLYQKCKSGGTYRLQSTVVLTGATDAALYEIPMQLPIGGTTYKAVLPSIMNVYGLKVTAQQTVAGAGNLTIDHEWFDSKS